MVEHTEDARWFRLAIAAASAASTALLVVVIYILNTAASDLKDVRDGFNLLATKVAVHDTQIINLSTTQALMQKRLDIVQMRALGIGEKQP